MRELGEYTASRVRVQRVTVSMRTVKPRCMIGMRQHAATLYRRGGVVRWRAGGW
jgi:hypothetical protein